MMFHIKAPLRTICASFLYVFVGNTFMLLTFCYTTIVSARKSSAKNAYQKCAKMHQLFRIRTALKCISYFELGVDLLIIVQCM